MNIRPVSDLRTKFKEIENEVNSGPVFLTKNGYGSFVIMSMDDFDQRSSYIDRKLLEAQAQAQQTSKRLTHEEMFGSIREELNQKASYAS